MSILSSDLFCSGNHFNAMASTVEDGREYPSNLLENSDVGGGEGPAQFSALHKTSDFDKCPHSN